MITGVVEAHLAQMERYLNTEPPECDHRLAHRQLGVFRDFWELNHLLPRDRDGRDIYQEEYPVTNPKISTFQEILHSQE